MNPEDRSLCLNAPAKINLYLRVLARRPDGYHELETWMQKLTLYDRVVLTVRNRTGIRLRCSCDELPADETNLAWKAAAVFFTESRFGNRYGVDISLEKNIPTAAGLGGGSSDAGTVLKGLNTLFDNEFPEELLLDFGRRIGADVPFFVTEYPAVLATGIGDRMVPARCLDRYTFLLVNPGFSVSTRWVYESFALTRQTKKSTFPGFLISNAGMLPLTGMANDLEQVTVSRYPELDKIKKRLREEGAVVALMSGSGPTVFGIFPDEGRPAADIQDVAQRLRLEYGENVFVVKAVGGA